VTTLLQARPDIQAVQKRVEAEDRRLAAAIGARLPQITLDFRPSYTWLNSEITGSGEAGTVFPSTRVHGWTWDAGAHFSVPIFDGLRGWSAIKTQRAVSDQLLEQYAETILTALLEVESSLVLERQERLRIQFLEDEFRLANITLEATRDRYRAGDTPSVRASARCVAPTTGLVPRPALSSTWRRLARRVWRARR